MSENVLKIIEKCINERILVDLTDKDGFTLEHVIPVFQDGNTVKTVFNEKNVVEFNNVVSVKLLEILPDNKRVIVRHDGEKLEAQVKIFKTDKELEAQAQLYDISHFGLALILKIELVDDVAKNTPVSLTVAGKKINGLVAYHTRQPARVGVKFEFMEGTDFFSHIRTKLKNVIHE